MDLFVCLVVYEGASTQKSTLQKVLHGLESLRVAAPTHYAEDERKRLPWDREQLIVQCETLADSYPTIRDAFQLWRTKAPRYEGAFDFSSNEVNSIELRFKPVPAAGKLELITQDFSNLVAAVPTIFAGVWPIWHVRSETAGLSASEKVFLGAGTDFRYEDVRDAGPLGLGARSWFGPLLRERFSDLLLRRLGAVNDGDATLRLDLVPQPWAPDPIQLLRKKSEVTDHLLATGMMARVVVNRELRLDVAPGPSWTPPPWKIT